MVPALPSVDGRSSDRGEKLDGEASIISLSVSRVARVHIVFEGGCVCWWRGEEKFRVPWSPSWMKEEEEEKVLQRGR